MNKNKNNYKKIKLENGSIVSEHRNIMEIHLGRKLLKFEEVHHIDNNRANNKISNLMVLSKSDHVKLHRIGDKAKKKTIIKNIYEGRKNRPNAKITIEQVREIRSMLSNRVKGTEIAKLFGITKKIVSTIKTGIRWSWVV